MGSEMPSYFTNLLNNESNNIDSVPLHPDDPYMTSGYLSSEAPDMLYETSTMTSQTASTTKKAQRSGNYSIEEDLLLVSAWLNVSLDAVKGNEQKVDIFKDLGEMGAFVHEHCWNVLKYNQKWISFYTKKAATAKPRKTKKRKTAVSFQNGSSPINLEEDNGETSEPSCMERPIGRKSAKDLIKNEKTKSNVILELEELKQLRMEAERKKEERFQLSFSQEEKLIALKQQKEEAKQQKEDDKIMMYDVTGLPEIQAAYIRDRQMEIMARRTGTSERL